MRAVAAREGSLILVVEDNKASRDLIVYLLRSAGHAVLACSDGGEAVEIAARERPDLILMDLQLDRIGGFEAASRLAADPQLASIPLVAVTAYAMAGDRERVLAGGFDDYITKPIEPTTFNAQVGVMLKTLGSARTNG